MSNKLEHLEAFANGFVTAMCFADSPEDSIGEWDYENLDSDCNEMITAICTIYLLKCEHVIQKLDSLENVDLCHWGSVGADLYYTMVGHGVGLWETDKYPEDKSGPYLDFIAKSMPSFEPYFDEKEMIIYC